MRFKAHGSVVGGDSKIYMRKYGCRYLSVVWTY